MKQILSQVPELTADLTEKMLLIKVPVSQCIGEVLDYLLHSEMGGEVDPTDPWHPTYESLLELKDKVLGEEESSDE